MAKEKTREEYRQEVERLNQWCDFLAKMLDEKEKDLFNAQTEIARLKAQVAAQDAELSGCHKVIVDQRIRHDKLGRLYDNAMMELENAKIQVEILMAKTDKSEQPETKPARLEPEPTAKRSGRKVTISDTDRQYVHELYKAVDGDGKRLHSIRGIADHVGISKSRVAEILQEPEQPGRWYSTDPTGSRTYYRDYHEALQSGKHIDYEVTV